MMGSISGFYYTPARGLFVGTVVAIGVALMAYRGYTRGENVLLNAAGGLAVVVALCPTVDPGLPGRTVGNLVHAGAALAFFALAALSIMVYGHKTISALPRPEVRRLYRTIYRVLTVMVVLFPAAALLLAWAVESSAALFAVETAALSAFAAFWLVKTHELARSHARVRIV